MPVSKPVRKVVLEQRFCAVGEKGSYYIVAQLQNYLDLDIGQRLGRKEVDRLIGKGIGVTVRKGRK